MLDIFFVAEFHIIYAIYLHNNDHKPLWQFVYRARKKFGNRKREFTTWDVAAAHVMRREVWQRCKAVSSDAIIASEHCTFFQFHIVIRWRVCNLRRTQLSIGSSRSWPELHTRAEIAIANFSFNFLKRAIKIHVKQLTMCTSRYNEQDITIALPWKRHSTASNFYCE